MQRRWRSGRSPDSLLPAWLYREQRYRLPRRRQVKKCLKKCWKVGFRIAGFPLSRLLTEQHHGASLPSDGAKPDGWNATFPAPTTKRSATSCRNLQCPPLLGRARTASCPRVSNASLRIIDKRASTKSGRSARPQRESEDRESEPCVKDQARSTAGTGHFYTRPRTEDDAREMEIEVRSQGPQNVAYKGIEAEVIQLFSAKPARVLLRRVFHC